MKEEKCGNLSSSPGVTCGREDVSWTFVPLLSATHGFSPKIDGVCSSAEVASSSLPLLLVQMDGHVTRPETLVFTVSLSLFVSDSSLLRAAGSLTNNPSKRHGWLFRREHLSGAQEEPAAQIHLSGCRAASCLLATKGGDGNQSFQEDNLPSATPGWTSASPSNMLWVMKPSFALLSCPVFRFSLKPQSLL